MNSATSKFYSHVYQHIAQTGREFETAVQICRVLFPGEYAAMMATSPVHKAATKALANERGESRAAAARREEALRLVRCRQERTGCGYDAAFNTIRRERPELFQSTP